MNGVAATKACPVPHGFVRPAGGRNPWAARSTAPAPRGSSGVPGRDTPPGWLDRVRRFVDDFPRFLAEFEELITSNEILIARNTWHLPAEYDKARERLAGLFRKNFEAYEEDKRRRLGDAADRPSRVAYKKLSR